MDSDSSKRSADSDDALKSKKHKAEEERDETGMGEHVENSAAAAAAATYPLAAAAAATYPLAAAAASLPLAAVGAVGAVASSGSGLDTVRASEKPYYRTQ